MEKRVEWIDMAKGIGIILVIFGHIDFCPQWWNVWLCSFHMPLFFFLSGITYNPNKYKKFGLFLKTKVCQLIIPYFIFALITWLWKIFINIISFLRGGQLGMGYLGKQLLGVVFQVRATDYGIGVWFIPCIFCAFILLFLIVKLSRGNRFVAFVLSFISLIIGYLYCTYIDIKLPWGIDAAFVAVFFMTLGMLFKSYVGFLECRGNLKLLVAFAASLMLTTLFAVFNFSVLGRTVGMWSNSYGNLLFFLGGAICGLTSVICFSRLVYSEYIQDIGRNSIFYYGIHILILETARFFTRFISGLGNDIIAVLTSTLLVAFTIIILKILYPFYKRIYGYTLTLFLTEDKK